MDVVVSEHSAIRSGRRGEKNEYSVEPSARKKRSGRLIGMWPGYRGGGRFSEENWETVEIFNEVEGNCGCRTRDVIEIEGSMTLVRLADVDKRDLG